MLQEEIFYFETAETFNGVLACDPVRNIRRIEKDLGVTCASRDLWIKISSNSEESLGRAVSLLTELLSMYRINHKPVSQQNFELMLGSFRNRREKVIKDLFSERIKVGKRKDDIIPRTVTQLEYIRAMREKDIVFGIGAAGTGKTYLAMAMAVSEFLAGSYSRIILTRPAKEAGETLGFLPGTLEEKILPYLRPLYDALYDMLDFDEVNALMEKNIIEVAPLAYMRGRTLNHAFVILDEAQNTSTDQMLMFLTRLGFDSCCVITGDPTQTDLEDGRKSGLVHAKRVLKDIPEIAFCTFTTKDVVRNSLIEKIVEAYQEDKDRFGRGKGRN